MVVGKLDRKMKEKGGGNCEGVGKRRGEGVTMGCRWQGKGKKENGTEKIKQEG